jgi:hypothetical protein
MDVEGAVGGAAGAAGVSRRLYPGDGEHGLEARGTGAGFIDWACVAPGGRARVMIDGVVREGTGYAERIETTVPPHLLPMRGLRWGRFVADDASSASAWIQWRGREERDLVLHDGAVWTAGEVSEGRCGWRGAGDGAYEIRIEPGRTLRMSEREGSVLESIPMVRNFAPPIVRTALGLRQTRWLARGRLSGAGRGASAGWVVHEVVTFPEVA